MILKKLNDFEEICVFLILEHFSTPGGNERYIALRRKTKEKNLEYYIHTNG